MSELNNIVNVTSETFQAQVIAQSAQAPVLVDYWADWCGPCQMQMPVLQKLVEEYAGKFTLAKVNTDEQRELAREHGIRSLPTMRLFRHGEMVEEILGAQTESTLRILLDRYIERASDKLRASAIETFQQGRRDEALEMLRNARQAEPDNHQLTLDTVGLCLQSGRLDEAGQLLAELPRDVRDEAEAVQLRALLDFSLAAADAPPADELEAAVAASPDDLSLRYQLGAIHVLNDHMEEALEAFMFILEHDRAFRDDIGRRSLLAVFDILGGDSDLVQRYRRRLFNALH
ncbi:MAG TPA: thioredoxin [Gammaproteobacteria bacterium]|nr:thioredoxin [Gammaproteobacteria bacterium]